MQTSIFDQKALIEAHNRTKNGLRLGKPRSQTKSQFDTPLFKKEEPKLFQSEKLEWIPQRINRELYYELNCQKPKGPRFARIWYDSRSILYFLHEYDQVTGETVRQINNEGWETLEKAKAHYLEVYRTYY